MLYVHGDTHFFKVDKPLMKQDDLLENFTRLETLRQPERALGEGNGRPGLADVFAVHPMIVKGN